MEKEIKGKKLDMIFFDEDAAISEKDYKSLSLNDFSLGPIPTTKSYIPAEIYEIYKALGTHHNFRLIKKDTNENENRNVDC